MKKILFSLALFCGVLFLSSCEEDRETYAVEPSEFAPTVTLFSPLSTDKDIETDITISGTNLQGVTTAYFDDVEVAIVGEPTATEIVIKSPSMAYGDAGIIKLKSSEGIAMSIEKFKCMFPLPEITSLFKVDYKGTDPVTVTGTNLGEGIVKSVYFGDKPARILNQTDTELTFRVPNSNQTGVDIIFNSLRIEEEDLEAFVVKTGVTVTHYAINPTATTYSQNATVGAMVTVTGLDLQFIESITLGGITMPNFATNMGGTELKFVIQDDDSFVEGEVGNTKELKLLYNGGSESIGKDLFFKKLITFNVYKDRQVNGWSAILTTHFFNFETGKNHSAAEFVGLVDPISADYDGAPCVATNQLNANITDLDYYSVEPYIYGFYLSSTGSTFYGPTAASNRLISFKSIGLDLDAKAIFGTPIVLFRTLSATANGAIEADLIEKVTSGTLANSDFKLGILDGVSFEGAGSDGLSNAAYGQGFAYQHSTAATTTRAFAPGLTGPKLEYNADVNTVYLVMYMKPNRANDYVYANANVYKFGYMHIKHLFQDPNLNSGRQNRPTFDFYWPKEQVTK